MTDPTTHVFNKRVYYSHCIAIYNTPQEVRDLQTLAYLGFSVVNPNGLAFNMACEQIKADFKGMAAIADDKVRDKYEAYDDAGAAIMDIVFRPVITPRFIDAVAFRALPDGRIPAGVAQEIEWARENGLIVFELPHNLYGRTMSVDATREYLKEVGAR